MFGIPGWAMGIGFIIVAGFAVAATGWYVFGVLPQRHQLQGRTSDALNELQGKIDALGDMQARLAEVEDAQRRLAEVEERLDFAERMLAQQRGAERLSSPKQ